MGHLFCFGYGYTANLLAKKVRELGWKVSGTYHRNSLKEGCTSLFRYGDPGLEDDLKQASHVLVSIPPSGDDVLSRYRHILRHVGWTGYLSSTEVYGNHGGVWVQETSRTCTTTKSGLARLRQENLWLQSGILVHIFRLSAIYGPNRSVLDKLTEGKIPIAHAPRFSSRIHVKDIVNILLASMRQPSPNSIYNCADDLPSRYLDLILYGALLIRMETPLLTKLHEICDCLPKVAPARMVCNNKVKSTLGVSLRYPNYMTGLQNILSYIREPRTATSCHTL